MKLFFLFSTILNLSNALSGIKVEIEIRNCSDVYNISENNEIQVLKLIFVDSCNQSQVLYILKKHKNLVELDLSNNNITQFPDFENFTIESLNLSNNKIKKILEYEYLREIKSLNVSNNEIEEIGNVFYSTSYYWYRSNSLCLESLDLSYNKIIQLKKSDFVGLVSLKYLNLKNNTIRSIHSDTFKNLERLEDIHLSFNKLHEIPKDLFHEKLSLLKQVDLSNNFLTEIELWPLFLSNISVVNFDNNSIEMFTNKFLIDISSSKQKLPNLSKIYLRNNKIEHFDDRSVQQYGICNKKEYNIFYENYLKAFNLSGNPIQCFCNNLISIVNDTSLNVVLNSLNLPNCDKKADARDPCIQENCTKNQYKNKKDGSENLNSKI